MRNQMMNERMTAFGWRGIADPGMRNMSVEIPVISSPWEDGVEYDVPSWVVEKPLRNFADANVSMAKTNVEAYLKLEGNIRILSTRFRHFLWIHTYKFDIPRKVCRHMQISCCCHNHLSHDLPLFIRLL